MPLSVRSILISMRYGSVTVIGQRGRASRGTLSIRQEARPQAVTSRRFAGGSEPSFQTP